MFRRLSVIATTVALVAGLVASSTGVSSAEPKKAPAATQKAAVGWSPVAGAAFNNPVGKTRRALTARVINAINHTPTGETIRIAAYSFDRKDVANALLRAHARGVNVQMVINDNWTSNQTRRLQRKFGKGLRTPSSLRVCHRSCRGGPGNLHMKVYAFSRTGIANNVVMTGSANMTDRAVSLQWNDLFTVIGNTTLMNTFINVFNQLKADKPVRPRRVEFTSGAFDGMFYRKNPEAARMAVTSTPLAARLPGPSQDPVMQRLDTVNCRTVAGYGDAQRRTVIRIMMYGWNGKRGIWLANKMVQKKRQGCNIKATLSVAGGKVVKILHAGGVPIKCTDWKYLSDGKVDFYNHMKMITINGTINGRPSRSTWTGSENWSGMSFRNDELILHITQDRTYNLYTGQFNKMWNGKASHSFGFKPSGKP